MEDAHSIQVPNQYPIPNGWAPLPIYGPGVPQGQVKPSVQRSLSMDLPVPVPGVTKKTRGRRVPTTATEDPRRKWKCDVCGGMFIRREHFKRHTKSVHTNERCTLSSFSALSGNEPDITFWQLRARSLDVRGLFLGKTT